MILKNRYALCCNVCNFKNANSIEINPATNHPVVSFLPEQKEIQNKGATMRLGASPIAIKPGTMAYKLYNTRTIYERHRHRYEVTPKYIPLLEEHGLVFGGATPDGERMEILELPTHYFFLATQYHPEFKSRPLKPHPLFKAFIGASYDYRCKRSKHQ